MKMNIFGLLILLISFYINSILCQAGAPIIETRYGKIEGTSTDFVYSYLGIPYALPPVNELRWQEPNAVRPWFPNILNATSSKYECPQPGLATRFSEDCLYLNVYATKKIEPKSSVKKAVLVFIHGGGFVGGYGVVPGEALAFYGDTIVVSISYRLGALGFLAVPTPGPGQSSGNYGILDQRLALQWVHENIDAFGGDNQRITIFGQSAGGQSVATHLLSAASQPFFANAIIHSGPLGWSYKTMDDAQQVYESLSNLLNCSSDNQSCLRNKTWIEIIAAESKVPEPIGALGEMWCPNIDGSIIKGQLLEIEKWITNDFIFKPFIIGTLPEEWLGAIYLRYPTYISVDEYVQSINSTFNQYANKVLSRYPPSNISDDRRYTLQHVLTAWSMTCSARNYTEKYISLSRSAQNQHYLFVFDYPQDFPNSKYPMCYNRTCHSGDMPYTFDDPDNEFKPDGHILALQHMTYWNNFAKYGTPNNNTASYLRKIYRRDLSDYLLYWPSYDLTRRNNIRFKAQPNEIDNNYLSDECNFFDSIGYYYHSRSF